MKKGIKQLIALGIVCSMVTSNSVSANGSVNESSEKLGRVSESTESSYIVDCKNILIYNKIDNCYADEKNDDVYLQDNNITTLEITEDELKEIEKTGAIVEEDICVTGSGKKKIDKIKTDKKRWSDIYINAGKKRDLPWNVESLGVTEETQNLETSSEENESQEKVKVAILDSGIDFSENINVVERKNFMDDEVSPLYEDNTGHGTAIAGIIASCGEDGMVKGVNPNVEIYSARILDEDNKAPISRVVESIYWAIEEDVDIINISFGTTVDSEILHNVIKDATDAGILVFAASGNQGEHEGSTIEYPAAYEEVVSVGATNPKGEVADMTSTGEELDIVAPGINIHSVGWLDMEVVCNGTSMAVPHAVGAASLLWQMDKDKTADFIKGLLEASAKTVEKDGEEYSYIDVEYAKEIYDEYCEKYSVTENVEEINEEYENDEEVDAYNEAVTGSWYGKDHENMSDAGAKYTGVSTSSVMAKICKLGAVYPDKYKKEENTLQGMEDNPQWHGYFKRANYFACYIYATKLALAGGKKVDSEYTRYQNDYNKMSEKVNKDGVCGKKWEEILSDFNYSSKSPSVQKSYRKYFIYGMAMHSATDIFAHSAYKPGEKKNKWLSHNGYDKKTKYLNYADDTAKIPSREKAAYEVAKEIFCSMYSGLEGSLLDFMGDARKYYDGTFYLGNVMWYADGVDLASYGQSNINRLKKVASGKYVDDWKELPGGLSY